MSQALKNSILNWFLTGQVGVSSHSMACAVLEVEPKGTAFGMHPHDPDDLNRCLKLLEAAPEVRLHFDKIAALSPQWMELIDNWAELEALFLEEAGLDWKKGASAPKTYKLMKSLTRRD